MRCSRRCSSQRSMRNSTSPPRFSFFLFASPGCPRCTNMLPIVFYMPTPLPSPSPTTTTTTAHVFKPWKRLHHSLASLSHLSPFLSRISFCSCPTHTCIYISRHRTHTHSPHSRNQQHIPSPFLFYIQHLSVCLSLSRISLYRRVSPACPSLFFASLRFSFRLRYSRGYLTRFVVGKPKPTHLVFYFFFFMMLGTRRGLEMDISLDACIFFFHTSLYARVNVGIKSKLKIKLN